MALIPYTFKISPELKQKMPDIARRHGFTPPQLLRAILTQLDNGTLTLKFHQNNLSKDALNDTVYRT